MPHLASGRRGRAPSGCGSFVTCGDAGGPQNAFARPAMTMIALQERPSGVDRRPATLITRVVMPKAKSLHQCQAADRRAVVGLVLCATPDSAHTPACRSRALQRILIEQGGAHSACRSPRRIGSFVAPRCCRGLPRTMCSPRFWRARSVTKVRRARVNAAWFDPDFGAFVDNALLNPLLRAGYPFGASVSAKIQFLTDLHTTLDEHR